MLILDTALARREAEGRPIRVGMIGAGFMGRGLANQIINSVPGMTLVAIANKHARIIWALLARGQSFQRETVSA